jgi:hypothetical protein
VPSHFKRSLPCGKSIGLGIAARLRAGHFGVQFPVEAKDLSLMQYVSNRSGARMFSYSVVTGDSSTRGVKWPGREVDTSYPSGVRIESGKGKVRPRTGHEGTKWERRYRSTVSLTSAIDRVWLVSATPPSLYPRERPGTQAG